MLAKRFVIFAALLAMQMACGKVDAPETTGEIRPIVLTKEQEKVRNASNALGLSVFKKLISSSASGDVAFSPLSLSWALSMCAMGAESDTWQQFSDIFCWNGLSKDDVAGYFQTLAVGMGEADPSVHIGNANSLWVNKEFPVKPSFSRMLSDRFRADAFEVDFSAPMTLGKVNEWIRSETDGLIPHMMERLDPSMKVLAINALLFSAPWHGKPEFIGERLFHGMQGDRMKSYFKIKVDGVFGLFEEYAQFNIPYGNGAYEIIILLPNESVPLERVIANLSYNDLHRGNPRFMNITFPEYLTSWESGPDRLIDALKDSGLSLPFSGDADFSGIHEGLSINSLMQKSKIEVNRKGSTIAVATEAEMMATGTSSETNPRNIVVDRPFTYFVRETTSGTILLMGTLSE